MRKANMNEREETEAFESLVGVDRAQKMLSLYGRCFPRGTEYDFLFGQGRTKEQVFIGQARLDGYLDSEIKAFLRLQGFAI